MSERENRVGTTAWVLHLMDRKIFPAIRAVYEDGQAEYADPQEAFSNFERLAADLDIDRRDILWVYAMKHRDGIASYLRGHESQREDVRGRIKDLMTYLAILWAMIEQDEQNG